MKISNPLQKKGNKKSFAKNSKSKVKAGGKKQQRPLWQRASLVAVAFVLLGSAGSFGWYYFNMKKQANQYKAYAGAYRLKVSDYPYNQYPSNGVRFALCKKYEYGRYAYIGIASRPQLANFYSRNRTFELQTGYGGAGKYTTVASYTYNNNWFNTYPDAISFTVARPENQHLYNNMYFRMKYHPSWTNKDPNSGKLTYSNWIPAWLINTC